MADFGQLVNDPVANLRTMRDVSQPGADPENHDVNFNPEDEIKVSQDMRQSTELNEHVSVPETRNAQVVGTLDPMNRQVYERPPAGIRVPQNYEQLPSRQCNYKMASDIFGTGMDKTWTAENGSHPGTPNSAFPSPITGVAPMQKSVPRSFKITELSQSSGPGNEEHTSNPAGRRARESTGNPMTGQGYIDEAAKTGKRYFEGSNANQKLW